jgi:hypothetical protein
MKKEHADKTPGWNPAGRLPLAGDRRKAMLISLILGGVFITVASRWVLQEVAERKEPYRFRQSFRMEAPVISPEKPLKNSLSGPGAAALPDYYSAAEAPAGWTQGVGRPGGPFNIGDEYAELMESPAGRVITEEPSEGLIEQRMEVRMGGSWFPLDGSGNVIIYSRTPGRTKPLTYYTVFFRLTTDHNGQLVDFEVAGIMNKFNREVQIQVPDQYIEKARSKAETYEYEPTSEKDELREQFVSFFYCPDFPNRIFTRPGKN